MASEISQIPIQVLFSHLSNKGKALSLNVAGKSMRPLIEDRDRVTVVASSPSRLRRGDIIVFCSGKRILVHRIIQKRITRNGISFCQKGDSSSKISWIGKEEILGTVTEIQKRKTILLSGMKAKILSRFIADMGFLWLLAYQAKQKLERHLSFVPNRFLASKFKRVLFVVLRSFVYLAACSYPEKKCFEMNDGNSSYLEETM